MSNITVMSSAEIEAVFQALPGADQARYIEQVRKYAPAVARRLTSILVGESEPLNTAVAERRDEYGIALDDEDSVASEFDERGEPLAVDAFMSGYRVVDEQERDSFDVDSFLDQLDD